MNHTFHVTTRSREAGRRASVAAAADSSPASLMRIMSNNIDYC